MRRLLLYRTLFNQSFLFDKFSFANIHQCPRITSFVIKLGVSDYFKSKVSFYKLLVLFYILTGQKPNVVIANCSLRGLKKKKIIGLELTVRQCSPFFDFITFRQLSLSPFFRSFSLKKAISSFSFTIEQKTQDDDVLLQVLRVSAPFKYQVNIQTTSTTAAALQSLLVGSKVPCVLS